MKKKIVTRIFQMVGTRRYFFVSGKLHKAFYYIAELVIFFKFFLPGGSPMVETQKAENKKRPKKKRTKDAKGRKNKIYFILQ
jgi:hypothetical protein